MFSKSYRKVIAFGNASFVITLPISWVRKNKITDETTLLIELDKKNNSLIVKVAK